MFRGKKMRSVNAEVTRSVSEESAAREFSLAYVSGYIAILLSLFISGCGQDMADQPRYEPLEASDFFSNGMSSRPLVEGTVARGHLRIDDHLFRGKVDGKPAQTLPLPLSRELLERGAERYNIFCAPCHGRTGYGQGMVVQRGFPAPASLHIERLRAAPPGYLFDTITHGFGRMPSYASQIPVADRWAIVAYVKALQFSQHAERDELPPKDFENLNATE